MRFLRRKLTLRVWQWVLVMIVGSIIGDCLYSNVEYLIEHGF